MVHLEGEDGQAVQASPITDVWEARLRRLSSLRNDEEDDLATRALAEIDRLRGEVERVKQQTRKIS